MEEGKNHYVAFIDLKSMYGRLDMNEIWTIWSRESMECIVT